MQKPILVTGPHHSGSTWTGKMVAAAPGVGYIHEPMNPTHRPGICAATTKRYFLNVEDGDPERWAQALRNTATFQYDMRAEWDAVQTPKDIARMIRDAAIFGWHRYNGRRALLKDPIALFSAEWIAQTLGAQVVMLMRHPASFISSLKRLEWLFPFQDLAAQSLLMRERLTPFASEIRDAARQPEGGDLISRGSLLWCIFAHVIDTYQRCHEDWLFVRHEDLAHAPVDGFQQMYGYLRLPFTRSVQQTIQQHTSQENPSEVASDVTHKLQRDSARVTQTWKTRLTQNEIDQIYTAVQGYAPLFYGDASWK